LIRDEQIPRAVASRPVRSASSQINEESFQ
jgi:hypothetical protein